MKLIPIASIKISSNRQRRTFDAAKLHAFGDSIARTFLQHAIVLRIVGDDYILVSGERRLRAITNLAELGTQIKYDGELIPLGQIPYRFTGDLNPLEAEEAELSENIHREDLSWFERAAAHKRLETLRNAQAAASGAPPPSTEDLSLEVRGGSGSGRAYIATRKELIVADHLDNPAVAAAKDVDEAFKILKKEESAKRSRDLGASVGKTFTADIHKAINGDALGWLLACPPEQFDVILTDPPYGMGADEFGDSGGLAAGAHGYTDDPETAIACYKALAAEGYRITKPQAHLYAFCDFDHFHFIKLEFEAWGWWVFRTPLIWFKRNAMRAPWPENGPQRKYETILYAVKGKRTTLKMAGDVLEFPPDSNLGHAAQKPVALFEELLRRSVLPGNTVLDPFAGSGTIFPAAHAVKCAATGVEADQVSYGIMVKRIERLRAQKELDLSIGL